MQGSGAPHLLQLCIDKVEVANVVFCSHSTIDRDTLVHQIPQLQVKCEQASRGIVVLRRVLHTILQKFMIGSQTHDTLHESGACRISEETYFPQPPYQQGTLTKAT